LGKSSFEPSQPSVAILAQTVLAQDSHIMDAHCQSKECRKGSVAALQRVLASECTYSDSELAYLLRVNAGFNHVDCVSLLLEKKADPSLQSSSLHPDGHGQRSSTGRNSLHEACLWGASAEVVSLLLEYRADVNLEGKQRGTSKTAYAMAVSKGHEHLAQAIAKASCASQVQARLGQEFSPAVQSPPPEAYPGIALCTVCLESPAAIACNPCGHRVFCLSCRVGATANTEVCPICRNQIMNFLQIY